MHIVPVLACSVLWLCGPSELPKKGNTKIQLNTCIVLYPRVYLGVVSGFKQIHSCHKAEKCIKRRQNQWKPSQIQKTQILFWLDCATLYQLPYCTSYHIVPVTILYQLPYCTSYHIVPVTILYQFPYYTSYHIVPVIKLFSDCHSCIRIMNMHSS